MEDGRNQMKGEMFHMSRPGSEPRTLGTLEKRFDHYATAALIDSIPKKYENL